jgi:hypothetical protein
VATSAEETTPVFAALGEPSSIAGERGEMVATAVGERGLLAVSEGADVEGLAAGTGAGAEVVEAAAKSEARKVPEPEDDSGVTALSESDEQAFRPPAHAMSEVVSASRRERVRGRKAGLVGCMGRSSVIPVRTLGIRSW